MTIETVEYEMPEYVAPYAMYGEDCGDGELESAYDSWLYEEIKFNGWKGLHLVDVKENGFMAWHELKPYGIGACDTSIFVFHIIA